MPFKTFQFGLEPFWVVEEAAAALFEKPNEHVLLIGVKVLATIRDGTHHRDFGFALTICTGFFVVVTVQVVKVLRRGGVYTADQRVLEFERLKTAEDHRKNGPDNSRETTNKTQH